MTEYIKSKKSNCKNCYKCIRHCPVKSIRFSNNQANIVASECILCGNCYTICPQHAKEIRNDISVVNELIKSRVPVYASIAPSFISNYKGISFASMRKTLKNLGFTDAEETAVGATIVKKQYEKMTFENTRSVIISSCCHTVNTLIQNYYPHALPFLADIISPMQAECMDIKRRFPEAKTVFIGPCISKKAEAELYPENVDCVLTFEELTEWMKEERIYPESDISDDKTGIARLFPTSGGIINSMIDKNPDFVYLSVDGIENCMHALDDIINGKIKNCFIEMSACIGSCIGGPAKVKKADSPVSDYISVNNYAGKKDFSVFDYTESSLKKNIAMVSNRKAAFNEKSIKEVLSKIGKTLPEHELNCGGCGYNTCIDKACAVLEGKADLNMCLPYLIEKAESFSDNIIKNTPNAIIVLNENLEVQLVNSAACKMMNIKNQNDVLNSQVVCILDPLPFMEAYQNGKNTYDKSVYIAEYKKYAEQTVIYDKSHHIIICFMRDITEETNQRENKEAISRRTMEIADKVIEKQMRSVQEIASLLGETTAETKVALTKLKESLKDE